MYHAALRPAHDFLKETLAISLLQSMASWSSDTVCSPHPNVGYGWFRSWSFFLQKRVLSGPVSSTSVSVKFIVCCFMIVGVVFFRWFGVQPEKIGSALYSFISTLAVVAMRVCSYSVLSIIVEFHHFLSSPFVLECIRSMVI